MINHKNEKKLNNNSSKHFNDIKTLKSEGLDDNSFDLNDIESSNLLISNSNEDINPKNNIFELDENKVNHLFYNENDNINTKKQYKNKKYESSNPPKIINKYITNSFQNINSQLKEIKEYNEIHSSYINILDLKFFFLESQIKKLKLLNKKRKNHIQEKIGEIKWKHKM